MKKFWQNFRLLQGARCNFLHKKYESTSGDYKEQGSYMDDFAKTFGEGWKFSLLTRQPGNVLASLPNQWAISTKASGLPYHSDTYRV